MTKVIGIKIVYGKITQMFYIKDYKTTEAYDNAWTKYTRKLSVENTPFTADPIYAGK
jgi:hypothetical protein